MNIIQKDIKALWRAPMLWLALALMTFISYWLLWQMIDKYASLQANFAMLSNPPTVTNSLWVPYVLLLAKLMMLLVAYSSSFSFAQERGQHTLWYLLINRNSCVAVIAQKFIAQMVILLFVALLLVITVVLLSQGGELNALLVTTSMIGLFLYIIWLIAMGMMISVISQSSATAFLASVMIFTMFWMLGGESVAQEYGVNWLHLLSPAHHLRWFTQGELSLSSVIYFVIGTCLFFYLAADQLRPRKS
ncbi:MAG: ABC transporter permease subunit [Marinicella sp.]|nr:ABC transporter permease subunit [Xanthomonadales bacterium]